jgi:hypothetical protein
VGFTRVMKKILSKVFLKRIMMILFLFIVSLDVLIDYVEILSGDYSFEVQTVELHAPNQFRSLDDIASACYYSQFNNESEEDDYESKYHVLTVLSYIKYNRYISYAFYSRSINSSFSHKEYNAFQEYSIPPPVV